MALPARRRGAVAVALVALMAAVGLAGADFASDSKMCVLIKDRDDPAIGIKVNVTRAMDLPSACSVPAVLSDCPKLLHISPDSKEAEIFKQYAIHEGKNATAGTAGGKHTDAVSGEGRHTAVVFAVVVSGLLTSIFVLA
ncbi:hypothetical protein CFC21_080214 [Triticum aestivum]|uniref:Bifunctional inhibitor/plant lipid transfer protein/seed storage helical domain-containing protein n=2 Tax=Triticum aestivum TaxID=4565 RepID=A0A3B6MYR0_WHEAT|nr:hypothetical protein CFC21_080214 [Triticum aestivum]